MAVARIRHAPYNPLIAERVSMIGSYLLLRVLLIFRKQLFNFLFSFRKIGIYIFLLLLFFLDPPGHICVEGGVDLKLEYGGRFKIF
jgi:hypothetical protein